jgi:hypothetical protein
LVAAGSSHTSNLGFILLSPEVGHPNDQALFGGATRVIHRQGRLCYYFQRLSRIAIRILSRRRFVPAPV